MENQRIGRLLVGSMLALVITLTGLHGEVVPGRWEKVELLPLGQKITVHLVSGQQTSGKFRQVTSREIELMVGGREKSFSRDDVLLIEKVGDRLVDGMAKGAGIGALAGLPWLIWGLRYSGGEQDDARRIGAGLFALSAAVGLAAGTIADAAKVSREVVYRSPHPRAQR